MLRAIGSRRTWLFADQSDPKAKKEEASSKSPADLKFEEMQQYASNLDAQVLCGMGVVSGVLCRC